MKILVSYFTQTGNTEKVARAIHEAVSSEGHDARLAGVDEISPDSLSSYDLVFLGSACHSADLAQPVKQILAGIAQAPTFKLAGFVTHATFTPEGGARQRELYEAWASKCVVTLNRASEEKQIDFLGYFGCQGAPSPPIEEFIRRQIITDEDEWNEYVEDVGKHPTENDLQKAREFALQVLAKC